MDLGPVVSMLGQGWNTEAPRVGRIDRAARRPCMMLAEARCLQPANDFLGNLEGAHRVHGWPIPLKAANVCAGIAGNTDLVDMLLELDKYALAPHTVPALPMASVLALRTASVLALRTALFSLWPRCAVLRSGCGCARVAEPNRR